MRKHSIIFSLITMLMLVVVSSAVSAAEWGTIKGRLVYKGTPPVPKKIKPTKDVAVCGKHPLVDESLVVGKDGGLANAFIYSREKSLDVHPDYEATAKDEVELDNKMCRYAPHCAVLRTSQTLLLKNSDAIAHNVKGESFSNGSFNVLIPPGAALDKTFTKNERFPATVGCNIHPWMSGYVLIRDDPYMAVSAEDGTFEIKNVPVGEVEFQLWQEKAGYLDGAVVQGKAAKKGRVKINVKPGVLDLGDIVIDAKVFE